MGLKHLVLAAALSVLASTAHGFGRLCNSAPADGIFHTQGANQMPANLKVAFIGDAGNGNEQEAVLTQIKNWGASFVIHSGDFEYKNDPQLFEDQINSVLGPDFPYFASIGNHDNLAWNGHEERLQARLERIGADKNCTGDVGVNMACDWQGMYFVLSGVGTRGNRHEVYMDEAFAASPAVWKVASWHKNQRQMQIGGKFDETGYDVYDTARKHGAIVATGHEHNFCRSYMMNDFSKQSVANFNETLNMKVGESFVFVSGLGGKDIRDWNDNLIENEWWAAYGASDNGILDGSLLCTFNVDGELRRGHCTFIDVSGKVWDDFDVYTQLPDTMEGLKAALADFERTKSPCHQEWIEVPVSRGSADAIEDVETGELSCRAPALSFNNKAAASLRFDNVPLKKGARIQHAYLQVYGTESDEQPAHFVIAGSKGQAPKCGQGLLRHQVSGAQTTASSVVWEEEDEDWEIQNVWVSPDLKEIVSEIVNAADWEEGNAITLNMIGQGNRAFLTFEHSPCFAPTLAIELEEEC